MGNTLGEGQKESGFNNVLSFSTPPFPWQTYVVLVKLLSSFESFTDCSKHEPRFHYYLVQPQ